MQKYVLDDEHSDTFWSMNDLNLSYSNLGRNQETLDLYGQILDLRKRLLSDEHSNIQMSMNAFTKLYSKLRRQGSNTVSLDRYYLPSTSVLLMLV